MIHESVKPARTAKELGERALFNLTETRAGRGPKPVSTGFPTLDFGIVGLLPGNILVIGGRPGHGKTALANNITESVLRQGHSVLTFSMEMSAEELMRRRAAALSGVHMDKLMRPQTMSEADLERVKPYYDFDPKLWFIDDRAHRTVDDIVSVTMATRALTEEYGNPLKVVVVDHVGLISGQPGAQDGRRLLIGEASRRLKVLSGKTGVCVILLTQLNRNANSRSGKKVGDMRPIQTDLAECDSLSHDASVILLVHQPSQYFEESPPDEAEIIIAKNRNGSRMGVVKMGWQGNRVSFYDYATGPKLRLVRGSDEEF